MDECECLSYICVWCRINIHPTDTDHYLWCPGRPSTTTTQSWLRSVNRTPPMDAMAGKKGEA